MRGPGHPAISEKISLILAGLLLATGREDEDDDDADDDGDSEWSNGYPRRCPLSNTNNGGP